MSITKKMIKNEKEFKDFKDEMKSTITNYPSIINEISNFVKDLKYNSGNIASYKPGSSFGSLTQQEYEKAMNMLEKMQSSAISKSKEGVAEGIKDLQDSIKGYNTNDPSEFKRFLKSSIRGIYDEINNLPNSKSGFNEIVDMLGNVNEVNLLVKKSNPAGVGSVLASAISARNRRIRKVNSRIEEGLKKMDQVKVDSLTDMISKYYKLYSEVEILRNTYNVLAQTGSSAKASLYLNNIKKSDADQLIPQDMAMGNKKDSPKESQAPAKGPKSKSTPSTNTDTSKVNANSSGTTTGNDSEWYDGTIKYIKLNGGALDRINEISKKDNVDYIKGLKDKSLTSGQKFDVWKALFQNWYDTQYPSEKKKFDAAANSGLTKIDGLQHIKIEQSDIEAVSKGGGRSKALELMKKAVAITVIERQAANGSFDRNLLTAVENAVKSGDYSENKDKDLWENIFRNYLYSITNGKQTNNTPPAL
ncbi:hypothetical protein Mia14_0375 [Candidatus Mancarchaeum acidiphilum]|uniref:Uncharacterized protein n=1 Tax=Candidatus Mancarchaeum acidiphilum TaxID=1920749 RepID=A0A218NMM3_9ARCH|nr:hypothetical protein [Candidatus Mancarchaeum acidiphilum]ASI13697.1 hypothetical protein Mia14_0375 [Candidatus Mancarchaeum acidiphilum]